MFGLEHATQPVQYAEAVEVSMQRKSVLESILSNKIVAVVRAPDGGILVDVAKALAAGGKSAS